MKADVIKKALEVVWPWIVENIWPVIQSQFITIFISSFGWFIEKIKELVKTKNEGRAKEAEENAVAAEKKADTETDESVIYGYRAEADVWRKVAEQYKEDLAELSMRVTELEEKTKKDLNDGIQESTPEVNFEKPEAMFSFKKMTWLKKFSKNKQ
jgi:hypothetical protein